MVPYALLFGEYPVIELRDEFKTQRKSLSSRPSLRAVARQEMEGHIARLPIQRAVRLSTPTASDTSLKVGENVLVWRETLISNRIEEWKTPYNVFSIDRGAELAYTRLGSADNQLKLFNLSQVKLYVSSQEVSSSLMGDICNSLEGYRTPQTDNNQTCDMQLTKIPKRDDPCATDARM